MDNKKILKSIIKQQQDKLLKELKEAKNKEDLYKVFKKVCKRESKESLFKDLTKTQPNL